MKVGHFYTATAGVPDRQGGTSLHRRLHIGELQRHYERRAA